MAERAGRFPGFPECHVPGADFHGYASWFSVWARRQDDVDYEAPSDWKPSWWELRSLW